MRALASVIASITRSDCSIYRTSALLSTPAWALAAIAIAFSAHITSYVLRGSLQIG